MIFSHAIHTKIIDAYSSKSKIINFATSKINIMSDIPVLISDLAIILFSAGLITILFKWLKQPVVLGYIMAGIIAVPTRSVVQ